MKERYVYYMYLRLSTTMHVTCNCDHYFSPLLKYYKRTVFITCGLGQISICDQFSEGGLGNILLRHEKAKLLLAVYKRGF